MSCPHSTTGTPDWCSQCLDVPVRRVVIADNMITVDGQPVRRNEDPMERRKYGRRGGKR